MYKNIKIAMLALLLLLGNTAMASSEAVSVVWNMDDVGTEPLVAVDGIDAAMSFVGMDYNVRNGYVCFSADHWIDHGGLNSDIYVQYVLAPRTDTLVVDAIEFDAARYSTDMMHFTALYECVRNDTAICLVDASKPSRDAFEHYTCMLPAPVMVVPGDTFVIRFYPFPTSGLMKKKYTISYKDMTFVCRLNVQVGDMDGDDGTMEEGQTATPVPSIAHGIYEEPFALQLTCDDGEAAIYYTTDGTVPSKSNGTLYTSALTITGNTVLRAVAVSDSHADSEVMTATYLFLDDVLGQRGVPEGYPEEWGRYATRSGYAKGDYELDPEMTSNSAFGELLKEGFASLPIISLVTDPDHLFNKEEDEQTGGIYIYTGAPSGSGVGRGWERPVSFEMFDAQGVHDLQVNCGLKIHGGHSRLPEKSPKHSLRLVFRKEYGPGKLHYPLFGMSEPSKLNAVVLRTAFCNSWHHQNADQREIAVYSRDMWAKHTQKEMGHLTTNGIYAHLFINGLYWGMYNPTERVDDDFCDAHLGGNKEDYDVIKVEEYGMKHVVLADGGSMDKWNEMFDLADKASDMESYYRMQGRDAEGNLHPSYEPLLDVENFVDYMLINYYGGNSDWDSHNWLAVRNRVKADEGFHFICWDTEHILKGVSDNELGTKTEHSPTYLFHKLMENVEFEHYFFNRVQKHCFDDGLLTPHRNAERWLALDAVIDTALYCEQARWGDYRRDVHQYTSKGELYTKQTHYDAQRDYLLATYFPQRTDKFVAQLRGKGWFPQVEAPVILFEEASAVGVDTLEYGEGLTLDGEGQIYYTTDGKEPVSWRENSQGCHTQTAIEYDGELIIPERDFTLKVIAYDDNTWSAVREQHFVVRSADTDIDNTVTHTPALNVVYDNDGHMTLVYTIREAAEVTVDMYDMQGKRKVTLHGPQHMPAGTHTVLLTRDELCAGIYLCRLVAGTHALTVKVVIK